jgi:hypothetical protein
MGNQVRNNSVPSYGGGGGVAPSFKAKTKCIHLCVSGLSFTHKAINSEINSITNVYYIES